MNWASAGQPGQGPRGHGLDAGAQGHRIAREVVGKVGHFQVAHLLGHALPRRLGPAFGRGGADEPVDAGDILAAEAAGLGVAEEGEVLAAVEARHGVEALLAELAGVGNEDIPCVYWFIGATPAERWAETPGEIGRAHV